MKELDQKIIEEINTNSFKEDEKQEQLNDNKNLFLDDNINEYSNNDISLINLEKLQEKRDKVAEVMRKETRTDLAILAPDQSYFSYTTSRTTEEIENRRDDIMEKIEEDGYGEVFKNQKIQDESDLFRDESELLLRDKKWYRLLDSESTQMQNVKKTLSLVNHILDGNVKTDFGGSVDAEYLKKEVLESFLSCETACEEYLRTHKKKGKHDTGIRRKERVQRILDSLRGQIEDISKILEDLGDGMEVYDNMSVREMLVEYKTNGPIHQEKKELHDNEIIHEATNDGDMLLDALEADRQKYLEELRTDDYVKNYLKNNGENPAFFKKVAVLNGYKEKPEKADIRRGANLINGAGLDATIMHLKDTLFATDFNIFLYGNEEEFKAKFVKNYKLLEAFEWLDSIKDGSFAASIILPNGFDTGDFIERLQMAKSIKKDYEKRIRKLQGKQVSEDSSDAYFKMGMRDINVAMTKRANKRGKKAAKELIREKKALYDKFMKFVHDAGEEYISNGDVMVKDALLGFYKAEAEKTTSIPEITDEYLCSDKNICFYEFDTISALSGDAIMEIEKHTVEFKKSKEYDNLSDEEKKEYEDFLKQHRDDRTDYEKAMFQDEMNSNVILKGQDRDFRLEGRVHDVTVVAQKPKNFDVEKLGNAKIMMAHAGNLVKDEILSNNDYPDEKMKNNIVRFAQWRMGKGISLLPNDPRWGKLKEFEKTYSMKEEPSDVTISFGDKTRTLKLYIPKTMEKNTYSLKANSNEEFDQMISDMEEMSKAKWYANCVKGYIASRMGKSLELFGEISVEFSGLTNYHIEKCDAIYDKYNLGAMKQG